jgi:hypothetical protein
LLQRTTPKSSASNGRPTANTNKNVTGFSPVPTTAEQIVAEQNASFEYGTTEGSEQTKMLAAQDAGLFDEPKQPPTTQPAPPPGSPTSSGGIDFNAGLAGSGEVIATPPQNASAPDKVLANEEETAAVNAYIDAGGTFPRGTGPITSGPLFDNVVAAKAALTARQQVAAGSATTSTPPQDINREF